MAGRARISGVAANVDPKQIQHNVVTANKFPEVEMIFISKFTLELSLSG
jgi:hypothetical protein